MGKEENAPRKFDSLSELHRVLGLPKPLHPLISLVEVTDNNLDISSLTGPVVYNFYKISLKTRLTGRLKYGQRYYDFEEGGLLFKAPNQVAAIGQDNGDYSGFTMVIHPDYFLNYPLAKKIKQYGFFSYSVNEALHLSEKEKATIVSVFRSIQEELQSRIDDFSHDVVISLVETLLTYSQRFYKRQFLTRKATSNDLLEKLEELLADYFDGDNLLQSGLPTVKHLADQLNLSPSYLSDMLRTLTGQNAQQHIHNKLIEKAKEKITTTNLSISEIAYELGFEHPSSFNKLFNSHVEIYFNRSFPGSSEVIF